MTEKIEPALSAEEWAVVVGDPNRSEELPDDVQFGRDGFLWAELNDGVATISLNAGYDHADVGRPEALIAVLNAALPGSDPRKITRETIVLLRETARDVSSGIEDGSAVAAAEMHADALRHLADALESYLPPLV